MIDAAGRGGATLQADAAREVRLRVHVDEEDALLGERERGGEVDRGRGLADAALLICNGPDASCH